MKAGMLAGIIACILAVLGILFLGFVFVPIAFVVAVIGIVLAVKAKAAASIGVNVLAWVLVVVGFATSPVLLGIIGIGAAAISSDLPSRDDVRATTMSSGLSSKDEARATSIKADIGTVVQAIPAWYAGQQEVSIVNAIQLDTNLWKQNGDKAEYIYCDDLKTSGVNCKGGKITLKIVLLTPDESNNANAGNIALTKDAVNEINGVVKSNAIGKNKPWLVVDVEPKGSGIVHKLSRDFGVKDVSIALAAKKIVWH